uniref:Titin n=1 Tax=Kryptolebias marmoratus TaxID=37003 RepID=A0A3Q2ZJU4_KRYMA
MTSIPVNVKVLDRPGPPDGLLKVKVVSAEKCNLHWNPPLNDGGATVTHYIIEKRETSRVTWTGVEPHIEAVSYKVSKLVPGKEYIFRIAGVNKFGVGEFLESEPFIAQNPFTTPSAPSTPIASEGCFYYFRVLAVNEFGTGLPAETPEAVKVSEAPLPPGKITLSDVTCNSAKLSWEKPDHDGGSKITGYIVEMQAEGEDTWIKYSESKAQEMAVNGLTQGKEYFFRVSAVNEKGRSEPKSLLTPVMVKDTRAEPVINLLTNTFSVKAGNDLKIDVSFMGVPPPTAVWKKEGNALKETSRVNVTTSHSTSQIIIKDATRIDVGAYENQYKVTSVEEGLIYEFRVYAENMAVTNVTNTSVSLSWDKPKYDGGAKITGYIVERKELPDSCWLKCNFTNLLDTFLEVTGLTEGEEYDFRVIAKNAADLFSAPSETTGPITVQHDVEPPKIILDDQFRQVVVVKAGELLRIDADISGRPNPTVFWLKNGRNTGTKGRVEIMATTTHTSLLIRECVRKDSGQYTLTLQNTVGTTSKVAILVERKKKKKHHITVNLNDQLVLTLFLTPF